MDILLIFILICGMILVVLFITFLGFLVRDAQHLKKLEENTIPCPNCGSKRERVCCIDVSNGYQYVLCGVCKYKFKDMTNTPIVIKYCEDDVCYSYKLMTPEVDQEGKRTDIDIVD